MNHERLQRGDEYRNSRFKRGLDIVAGVASLPLVVAAIGVTGTAIKIENGGDIFYTQNRVGKDGRIFPVHKLRTLNDKGEITKVGLWVRPLCIDELPQILSVIKGDMSLFGIRALSIEDFERLGHLHEKYPDVFTHYFIITWQKKYLAGKPGGLSLGIARAPSVLHRSYKDAEGLRRKMEYDIEQCDNESVSMDLKITLTTIARAIREIGTRGNVPAVL